MICLYSYPHIQRRVPTGCPDSGLHTRLHPFRQSDCSRHMADRDRTGFHRFLVSLGGEVAVRWISQACNTIGIVAGTISVSFGSVTPTNRRTFASVSRIEARIQVKEAILPLRVIRRTNLAAISSRLKLLANPERCCVDIGMKWIATAGRCSRGIMCVLSRTVNIKKNCYTDSYKARQ